MNVLCDTDTIPDDVIQKMGVESHSKLIWRGYQPLITKIKKNPKAFGEELTKAVADVEEINSNQNKELAEIDLIREELHDFRNEIKELLSEALTRKKGWF